MDERHVEAVEISTDPSRVDLDVVHGYLVRSYWSADIPRAVLARALENSLCVSALVNGRQVGFARVVTDRATYAYLADVFVLEEFQGRGVGKKLVAALMQHPDLQGLRRWNLVTRDAHGLYEQFGFVPVSKPDRYMERLDFEVYKRGPA